MRPPLRRALLLCTLPALLAAAPPREEDLAPGFADIAVAASGTFVASGDGTVRRVDGDTLPVAMDTHHKLVGLAVSEDGQQVAAVGAGVVARSSDGGKTFRVEPTPGGTLVYAAAFSRDDLFLFDVKGQGFRAARGTQGFEPLKLPRQARFWTASFAGPRGYVVGQGGVLLGTQDGGGTWKELPSPTESQAVLALNTTVWVSGEQGVFRSDDAGRTFHQVYGGAAGAKNASCYRMGGRGTAVVVACAPFEHTLAYAADGEHFQEVRVPDAANLLSAVITPGGELLAVGAYELFIRATPSGGHLVAHSEQTRRWLDVVAKRRANEGAARHSEAQPQPPVPSPSRPEYPVREGEPTVLTGTVRDERGQPVPGLLVDMVGSWAVHGEGYQQTETDARGHFRFTPSRVRSARLSLKARGYAPESRVVPLSERGETVVDITLRPEVPLAGVVASPEGPVRQGAVTLWPQPPEGADLVDWRGHTVRVSSTSIGVDGSFHLAGVPAGEYLLEVQVEGFRPTSQRVRAPDSAVRVRVGAGAP